MAVIALAAGAAIAGAASSAYGSSQQAGAASDAAKAQQKGATRAIGYTMAGENQALGYYQPYLQPGIDANALLQAGFGMYGPGTTPQNVMDSRFVRPPNIWEFQQSPGYAWQLEQGKEAVTNSAAARGGVFGGNTMKALDTYGQGLANQDWWNFVNDWTMRQNMAVNDLTGLQNTGMWAAGNSANTVMDATGAIGNYLTGGANAQAAGMVGAAGYNAAGAQGVGNSLMDAGFLGGMYLNQPSTSTPFTSGYTNIGPTGDYALAPGITGNALNSSYGMAWF